MNELKTTLDRILNYPDERFKSNTFSGKEIKDSLLDDYNDILKDDIIEADCFSQELKEYEDLLKQGQDLHFPFLI